ncbi:DEAD/DEAH box helicase family protein, partial [Entomomonas asaccharolytica]
MERDSENSGVRNTTVQETISDEPTGARQSTGGTSERTGERVSTERGRSNDLSRTDAVADGKVSDSRVRSGNTTDRATQPTTRNSEQSRVSSDSDIRQDVEQARTREIIDRSRTREPETLYDRQLAANKNITTNFADKNNIKQALPVLFDAQVDDVYKAEKRLFKNDKLGILFTNGTGTGKTGTGSGVIRRFVSAGKDNIIVVVPNDKIVRDWVKFLKGKLDVAAKQLEGITDNGKKGVVVTTYANFGSNDALSKRNWDLVVADESHYLSSDEQGTTTTYLRKLRLLTGHGRGQYAFARSYFDEDYKKYRDGLDQIKAQLEKVTKKQEKTKTDEAVIEKLLDDRDVLHKQWSIKEKEAEAIYAKKPKSKLVMLSATPFAYVKNVDYAEGYLFDYSPVSESEAQGYNSGDAYDRFFIQHFGYRMRYNKLTRPDSNVDGELMEREFNEWLKKEGALSGRRLDIPYDYDRKFFLTEDAVGTRLDKAFEEIREAQDKDDTLTDLPALHKLFPYHERMYLLEAIKAKHSVDYIKESIKLGRKVVVFHDFNKGGARNPYQVILSNIKDTAQRAKIAAILAQPHLRADFSDLVSPLERFARDFDNTLVINGRIPKAQRERNVALFNDDNSGYNLIVVQSDAGREGISMHDTTGKHQRVLANLGLPVRPVAASQEEGRIYRTGQASNVIIRYFTTGTGWEASAFTWKIAERAGTAENLALGHEARALKQSFLDAYANASDVEFLDTDGTGGKTLDRELARAISGFDAAKTYYYGQQKNTKRRDQREGFDYYATPEPVGYKMVEWADVGRGDKVLEPSAGHGAIARFIPDGVEATAVEPSYNLSQRIGLSRAGTHIINDRFENHNLVNKYDAIVMNPPYGSGGKTAMEHLEKALRHLKPNGRVVALVPTGQFDKRFDDFLETKEAQGINIKARILMPSVTFEKAGTGVSTQILVIDKNNVDEGSTYLDFTSAKTINELFDRLEHIELKPRQKEATDEIEVEDTVKLDEDGKPLLVEHTTRRGKVIKGVIANIPKSEAKKIDEYTFAKDGGFFIREEYLDENNNFIISNNENTENKPVINLANDGKPLIVEHTTARGKVIKGIIANISKEQAKAIDKYTFQKEGGFFIREEYLDENGNLHLDQQYSRNKFNQGSNAVTLRSFINNTTKHWKNIPATTVVQSTEDLPEAIRHKINKDNADDASGIQHNGTVYLIADNIESTQHAS